MKTARPCFNCGSEAAWWMERNCDKCIKSSRPKLDNLSEYTRSRCRIFDEIGTQWMGYGNETVSLRTYDATQKVNCPYKKEHYQKQRKKNKDKSLTLNFE